MVTSRESIFLKMRPTILVVILASCNVAGANGQWTQLKGDALRSGNASECNLQMPIGLIAAIPVSDAIYTSPVVADGKLFVLDGAGVVSAIDTSTWETLWQFATRGGAGNCNNVARPALIGDYLHVGTTAGYYYVLETGSGRVVAEIDCQEPVFSAPVVGNGRVYFASI